MNWKPTDENSKPSQYLYHYKALVTRVVDGDTVVCDIDLGMGVWMHKQYIRLLGINAPELRGEQKVAGEAAKQFISDLIEDLYVTLRTYKDKTGKYGRWLGIIYDEAGCNINELMVTEGHAVQEG